MSTGDATPGGTRVGAVPTSRIVRIAAAAGPPMAALAVILTVAAAVPRDAWLPYAPGPALPADWERPLVWPLDWLSTLQITLGALAWPGHPVAGAIIVASLIGACTTGVLAHAFRTAGLTSLPATVLAMVAASATLGSWQAASPLGGAPIALASAVALWHIASGEHTTSTFGVRRSAFHRLWSLLFVGLAVVVGVAAHRFDLPLSLASWDLVRGDLGWSGLLLLVTGIARGARPLWADPVLVAFGAAMLLGTPVAGPAGAAFALPWAWWLAARGAATLISWRGAHATRWATAGLLAWVALNAARVPWGHQRQQAALVRTWAEGLVDVPTPSQPLTTENSPRGRLLTTLLRRGEHVDVAAVVVRADDVRSAATSGRRPIILGHQDRERFRWSGVALGELPQPTGVTVDRLVETLPRGTIVLAAISRTAAAQLTPTQWQSLGRIGLRLADAGSARAHAVVGVTRARVEGQEAAQAGAVRIDVLPGDPIGRTGARSPVDARLEADDTHVRVWLRDRPVVDARGLVFLFFSTRGDLLAWRVGTSPMHLDGAPLGPSPSAAALALGPLPCIEVSPGRETDAASAMREPALGVTPMAPGSVDVAFSRPEGFTAAASLEEASADNAEATFAAGPQKFRVGARGGAAVGVRLRGPVLSAKASSSVQARLCAAWPAVPALDPAAARTDVRMTPDLETTLAGGWHDIESAGNGRYFRWMSGPRAALLLALKAPQTLHFALDAQAVAAPRADDVVRLTVNGREAGARPLLPTRGLYEWGLDPAWLRAGLNILTIETTQTVRPAEHAAGADDRLLGMAVNGWTFGTRRVDAPAEGR